MLFHVISLFIDSQRRYTYIFFLLSHIRRYSWKTTEWTECKVDMLLSQQDRRRGNHTGMCGGGTQTREVYCVQASTDTPSNLSPLRSKEGNFSVLLNKNTPEKVNVVIALVFFKINLHPVSLSD